MKTIIKPVDGDTFAVTAQAVSDLADNAEQANAQVVKNTTPLQQRFLDCLNEKETTYNYIVTGDSTRFNQFTDIISYYSTQLAKIGMEVLNNSESGMSSLQWSNNERTHSLDAAIAATPNTGKNTIMEYSLGINDLGTTDVRRDNIILGLTAYLTAKPDAIIFLVSPCGGNAIRAANLARYEEVSSMMGLQLISGSSILDLVHLDSAYMTDDTHPNINGGMRLVNSILSDILPSQCAALCTMTDMPTFASPETLLEHNVLSGYWNTWSGAVVVTATDRCTDKIAVEPNFTINVTHGGNKNKCLFFDVNGDYMQSVTMTAGDNGLLVATIVPDAYFAAVDITDDGAAWDALNFPIVIEYGIQAIPFMTQLTINKELDIGLPYISNPDLDSLGRLPLAGELMIGQSGGTRKWGRAPQQAPTPKYVTSPHTLSQEDNGEFLVFNEADAVINIPTGLALLTSVMVVNIGVGGVTIFSQGSEVIKGSNQLGDADGMMSIIKLDDLVWQSSERGASVLSNVLVDGVLNIVVIGASIMGNSYSELSDIAAGTNDFYSNGLFVNIYPRAVGGDRSMETLALLPTVLAEFAGQESNTLFFLHTGGNNMSNFGPYPGGAAQLGSDYREIIESIKSAGFYAAGSSITDRVLPYTTDSVPYNENVINPLIAELMPLFYDTDNDLPFVDLWKTSNDFSDTGFIADGIHPNDLGQDLLRKSIALGVSPRVTQTNAPLAGIQDLVLMLGKVENPDMRNRLDGSLHRSTKHLPVNLSGHNAITASLSIARSTDSSTSGRGNVGDISESLTNHILLSGYMYILDDEVRDILVDVGSEQYADTFKVQVTASRDANDDRYTDVTIGGVTKQLLATANPPEIIEFTGVTGQQLLDGNIKWNRTSGSSAAYLSGVQITKE